MHESISHNEREIPLAADTTVVVIVHSRPDTTKRLLERLAEVKPSRMFVIADGPRPNRPHEKLLCSEVRRLFDDVPWECQISRLFSDENLGCRKRVLTGLDWVFEQERQAIILEDDVLPDHGFFEYCDCLLREYRDRPDVGHIGGFSCLEPNASTQSYFLSQFSMVWGWCTWSDRWKRFRQLDLTDPCWQRAATRTLEEPFARRYFQEWVEQLIAFEVNSWALPWQLGLWHHGQMSTIPSTNLVRNIGFTAEATHTASLGNILDNPAGTLEGPITHPEQSKPRIDLDRRIFRRQHAIDEDEGTWTGRWFWRRLMRGDVSGARKLLPGLVRRRLFDLATAKAVACAVRGR